MKTNPEQILREAAMYTRLAANRSFETDAAFYIKGLAVEQDLLMLARIEQMKKDPVLLESLDLNLPIV
jgi:hypothetical protein